MKKFFKITNAVIMKAITFILLTALTMFNSLLKIFTFIFRFVAIPAMLFGLLIVVVTYFDNGYSPELLRYAGVFGSIGAFYFLLPLIPQAIDRTKLRMKTYVFSPIIVRSPVKFTL